MRWWYHLVSLSFSWYHGFLLSFIDIVMDLGLTTFICKLCAQSPLADRVRSSKNLPGQYARLLLTAGKFHSVHSHSASRV